MLRYGPTFTRSTQVTLLLVVGVSLGISFLGSNLEAVLLSISHSSNIMNLEEVSDAQVMTPRTRTVPISAGATMEQAEHLMVETGRLRLPVYDGESDHVIGILVARDLWRAQVAGVQTLAEVLREVTFVPESKPIEELIREMRQQRIKMAIVLDEYGGTAGVVTLEDLIEETVGEIQDEHEPDPLPCEEALEGETRLGGSVPIDEVNERFRLSLPEGDFETVGGFVFGTLGRALRSATR